MKLIALSLILLSAPCLAQESQPPTTTTTEKVETRPDGTIVKTTTTTTATPRTVSRWEKGTSLPLSLSLGGYSISSNNTRDQLFLDSVDKKDKSGAWFKGDLTFFRPTRHEAMLSYLHGNKPNRYSIDFSILSLEYRWRFGAEGRAYYGINAGSIIPQKGSSQYIGGSALGYHVTHNVFVEFRGYYQPDDEYILSGAMIGFKL